jgi:hypothetical protein
MWPARCACYIIHHHLLSILLQASMYTMNGSMLDSYITLCTICVNWLLSYQTSQIGDLFATKLVTKVKPNINAVEVHPQLSNTGHWWVLLVHCGPFPMWLKFFLIGDVWRCVPLSKCVSAFCSRNHFPHKLEIKWFPDHELDWFPWFRLATNLQFTNGKSHRRPTVPTNNSVWNHFTEYAWHLLGGIL